MKKTTHYTLLLLLLSTTTLFGQIKISGKITDQKTNEPLIGAIVKIGETGAVADENGAYLLQIQKGDRPDS